MQTWNGRVEARRLALGLDKRQLALMIGVKPPTLQHWIDGKIKDLMVRNAIALCRVLGVRMEWLMDGEEPMSADETDLLKFVPEPGTGSSKVKPNPPESAAEIARIVKAALPVRQTVMEAACRFIIAADLASLPLIVKTIKEIALNGHLKNHLITDEEMAILIQFRAADNNARDGVAALLGLLPLSADSTAPGGQQLNQ